MWKPYSRIRYYETVTDVIEISARLEEWAALAGYSLTRGSRRDDGRALFWSDGGEIRHFIGANGRDWFVVTDSDRLGPEYLNLAARSMTTIEHYFFGQFGRFIRSQKRLARVHMPIANEEISPGFTIRTQPFDGAERLALIAPDGSEVAVSGGDKFSGTADLVKLSLFLTATADDIMTSYLDPNGKPLFTLQ
jgi:Immunity protein 61